MLKKLGNLRNNFQKLVIKKKLKEKRMHVETALQNASLGLAEINTVVKEVQENVESTIQLLGTYPTPSNATRCCKKLPEKVQYIYWKM